MAKLITFLLLGLLFFSCSQSQITIIGNIQENIIITETGNLAEIFESKNVTTEYILIIAADGTAFFISEKSIGELDLIKEKGIFQTETSTLPPVCNLNNITEICIYNSDFSMTNYETPFSKKLSEFELLGENSRECHFVRKYKRENK
jgi:hypothetical protein